jgi:hypothetical protein
LAETSARTDADAIQNTAIGANTDAITAEALARTTAFSRSFKEQMEMLPMEATLWQTSARTDADAIQKHSWC